MNYFLFCSGPDLLCLHCLHILLVLMLQRRDVNFSAVLPSVFWWAWRTVLVICLLTSERVLLHYKYSKQNTPEGELIQLPVTQLTMLIKCQKAVIPGPALVILPSTTVPPGSLTIRGAPKNYVGQWSMLTMSHSQHVMGQCFYPAPLCLFISLHHQGLLVTQIKRQLKHWNSREIKASYWSKSHSGELSSLIKQL